MCIHSDRHPDTNDTIVNIFSLDNNIGLYFPPKRRIDITYINPTEARLLAQELLIAAEHAEKGKWFESRSIIHKESVSYKEKGVVSNDPIPYGP